MAKKKKKEEGGTNPNGWMTTYTDMLSLLLCFFVLMFNPDEITTASMQQVAATLRVGGFGSAAGGLTLSSGRSADLGNTVMSLPSMEQGRALGTSYRKAVSVFSPEINSNKVRVTHSERGLVITLAADTFFGPASARLNIEQTRDTLLRLGTFLVSDELKGRKFRIEGHTDSVDVDPAGPWQSNWELSAARSINVLHYLTDIGLDEKRFQIAGFADTAPIATNTTREGAAYNRRVDIVILDDGHL